MIIDCHAGPGDGFTGPWKTRASLDLNDADAMEAGIDRTVLLPALHLDHRAANAAVARIVRNDPERYLAFVHCERDRGNIAALVR